MFVRAYLPDVFYFCNRSRVHGSEVVSSRQTRLPSLPAVWQASVGQVSYLLGYKQVQRRKDNTER